MGIDFSSLYGNGASGHGSGSSGTDDLKVCGIYHSTMRSVILSFSEFSNWRDAKSWKVNSIQVFSEIQRCCRQVKK